MSSPLAGRDVTEHTTSSARHTTGYLAAGGEDRPLIIYCDGGNRCAKASAALKAQGFTRVATLTGGIGAWQGAGLPIEK